MTSFPSISRDLGDLPNEVILKILKYLAHKDALGFWRARRVSRRFRSLAHHLARRDAAVCRALCRRAMPPHVLHRSRASTHQAMAVAGEVAAARLWADYWTCSAVGGRGARFSRDPMRRGEGFWNEVMTTEDIHLKQVLPEGRLRSHVRRYMIHLMMINRIYVTVLRS